MIIVNIHEAKTQLSKLLATVEQNKEIVRICRHGKPVAQLVPFNPKEIDPMKTHDELQGVEILYDPTAELSEDEWPQSDS